MSATGRRRRWKSLLAKIGLAILLAGVVAAWLLPAPTKPAQTVIAAQPEVLPDTMSSGYSFWAFRGPRVWDVRFLGSRTMLATVGPWNPLTFRDLTGARHDWTIQDDPQRWSGVWAPGKIWPYALSPDGATLAGFLDDFDRSVVIWDVATGQTRKVLHLGERTYGTVEQLVFSANGERLAVGWAPVSNYYRYFVVTNLLDTATWEERAALKLAADNAPALFRCKLLAISADGGSLAVLLRTGNVELWDVATGGRRATIMAPEMPPNLGPIAVWSFSPDGSVLAALRSDGQVGLWDAATGRCRLLDVVQADYPPESVPGIWRPGGGGYIPHVRKNAIGYGPPDGRPFTFSSDSKTLAVARPDGEVRLWDVTQGQPRALLSRPDTSFVNSGPIELSGDGRYLALAGIGPPVTRMDRLTQPIRVLLKRERDEDNLERTGRLIVWDLASGRQRLVAQAGGLFTALSFSPDGITLAATREEPSPSAFYGGRVVRDVMLWSDWR
jgi:WD40 repeat protein